MAGPFLKEITVAIPQEGPVVIRNEKRVEYQLERKYSSDTQDSRVIRRTIGKVDPVQPERMFPNEAYFELFPDNEVPKDIRDEFLRECEIKRQMKVIRRSPEEIIDNVVRGMDMLNQGAFRSPPGTPSADCPTNPLRSECFLNDEDGMNYRMLRRVFDEMYYAIEELAGKFPNEVIVPFKVERINEVLKELRGLSDRPRTPSDESSLEDPIYKHLRLIDEGLTYSDVMLIMKWYKVLPR
jgi:hypothetical protein